MSKIKQISERLKKNPDEYSEIRLLIAKRTLGFFMAFYFLSFLFTIGGFSFFIFSLADLAAITFHAYTILVIVLGWFLYEFSAYTVHVYAEKYRFILMIVSLILSSVFVVGNLFVHLFV